MRKTILIVSLLLLGLTLSAAFDAGHSDRLFYNEQAYQADYDYLIAALPEAAGAEEKADILWRLSRTVLTLTDDIDKDNKDARLSGYGKAQDYAEKSLDAAETPDGYLWLASSIGRIGQVKGVLNSLKQAKPMRTYCEKALNNFGAESSDTWYVLGVLYNQLSVAGNLSFGDKNFAISYMRRCIETQDNVNRANLTNYLELAEQLYDRGWDASKKAKRIDKMKSSYNSETVLTEKMKYYEGYDGKNSRFVYDNNVVSKLSDKQEAILVLKYALETFEEREDKLPADIEKAEKLKKKLAEYSK